MMGRLSQLPMREKAGLVFALVLVAFLITDHLVVKPLVRRLRSLDVAISVETRHLDQNKKVLSYEKTVEKQYESVKNLLGISGTEQESIEAFKNEIDEMSQRNAIRLKSMRHLAPERTDFLVTYIIEISEFETEVVALISFLNDIGNASGLIRVRDVVVTSQGANSVVSGSMVISKVMTLAADEGVK